MRHNGPNVHCQLLTLLKLFSFVDKSLMLLASSATFHSTGACCDDVSSGSAIVLGEFGQVSAFRNG